VSVTGVLISDFRHASTGSAVQIAHSDSKAQSYATPKFDTAYQLLPSSWDTFYSEIFFSLAVDLPFGNKSADRSRYHSGN
jgi:hypothetical protein